MYVLFVFAIFLGSPTAKAYPMSDKAACEANLKSFHEYVEKAIAAGEITAYASSCTKVTDPSKRS